MYRVAGREERGHSGSQATRPHTHTPCLHTPPSSLEFLSPLSLSSCCCNCILTSHSTSHLTPSCLFPLSPPPCQTTPAQQYCSPLGARCASHFIRHSSSVPLAHVCPSFTRTLPSCTATRRYRCRVGCRRRRRRRQDNDDGGGEDDGRRKVTTSTRSRSTSQSAPGGNEAEAHHMGSGKCYASGALRRAEQGR